MILFREKHFAEIAKLRIFETKGPFGVTQVDLRSNNTHPYEK